MDERDFKNTETGKLVWESKGMYYRFEPNLLPLEFNESKELNNLLVETSINLGRLDGIAHKFSRAEINLMLAPFIIREAKTSSEIEGTRSTLSDVYKSEKEEEKNIEKALDNEEIRNYRKALEWGLNELKTKEFSEEFIKEIHKILLRGVRGQNKNPGEYKAYQNAIGNQSDTFDSAKFVPASPETTPKLMKNLISFIKNKSINPLYNIAFIHYQFESIHPFEDGNGRIGRLLIILYLHKIGILGQPLIYISEFFNRYRKEYVDLMYNVSSENKVNEWGKFILNALNTQSKKALKFSIELEGYKREIKEDLQGSSKSMRILSIVDLLFINPYITIKDVVSVAKVSQPAASKLIQSLEKKGILKEVTKRKRNKIYLAPKILEILEI
ncbi:Fic family protein [Candidatus Pacearchaeota archaeon]|nr:Fic family protein [Candidatus Pacearchaeota archaeon]